VCNQTSEHDFEEPINPFSINARLLWTGQAIAEVVASVSRRI
jgi:hypothetical protein